MMYQNRQFNHAHLLRQLLRCLGITFAGLVIRAAPRELFSISASDTVDPRDMKTTHLVLFAAELAAVWLLVAILEATE